MFGIECTIIEVLFSFNHLVAMVYPTEMALLHIYQGCIRETGLRKVIFADILI